MFQKYNTRTEQHDNTPSTKHGTSGKEKMTAKHQLDNEPAKPSKVEQNKTRNDFDLYITYTKHLARGSWKLIVHAVEGKQVH